MKITKSLFVTFKLFVQNDNINKFETSLDQLSFDLLSKWIFANLIVEVPKNCLLKMLEERTKKFEMSVDLLSRLSFAYLEM
jgi:hypothetical protein